MILCLDSGNSRIKWGVHDGTLWLAQGAVPHARLGELAQLPTRWPEVSRVMLANVAGEAAAHRIEDALGGWRELVQEVKSSEFAGGVRNGYRQPERLGIDRWCALIGAHAMVAGAKIVVMAGTATTVDTLNGEGAFLGGMILPGIGLMLRALARETAALPFANGKHDPLPRCTDDAIVSGVLEAQGGAIERAFKRLPGGGGLCVLSGGNAARIAEHLSIPYQLIDNLPLEGLLRLAQESGV